MRPAWATDTIGNQTTADIALRLSIRDSSSSMISKASGDWTTRRNKKAIGGDVIRSGSSWGALTSTFEGKGIAIVAPVGPGRGRLQVRVDDGRWTTVRLKGRKPAHRRVVYSRALSPGTHVIEMRRLSGRPALDALIISR